MISSKHNYGNSENLQSNFLTIFFFILNFRSQWEKKFPHNNFLHEKNRNKKYFYGVYTIIKNSNHVQND
jgi:hypothetical protein